MTVTTKKSQLIHQGKVFTVFKDIVTFDSGITTDLDIIRHPGASAIVPLTNRQEVILIKQYRYAIGNFIWEIPAGTLEPTEPPLDCAKRELIEEAGVCARTWEQLGKIIPVPGYSDEQVFLFLATDLSPATQKLDPDEILQVHRVAFEDAVHMIHAGDIVDAKSITGILLAGEHLNRQNETNLR